MLFLNRIIKNFFFFVLFSDMLFICIGKVNGFIIMVHSADVYIWVNKVDWIHFKLIYYKGCFGGG